MVVLKDVEARLEVVLASITDLTASGQSVHFSYLAEAKYCQDQIDLYIKESQLGPISG